jgi:uncharacterized protein (TIRG00374 family)
MSQRWRACAGYRIGFLPAFHSLGVAMAGNMLIPGRTGEPLRVYALARRGLPAEISTSAIVVERLADQLFRIVFFVLALLLGGNGGADQRLLGVLLGTMGLVSGLLLLVRYRVAVSRVSGHWIGKLPRLQPEMVERFVRNTLHELATVWKRPGAPQALIWSALAWGLLAVHVNFILASLFGPASFTLACVAMAFGTPTAAAKPGYYHLFLVASMMVFMAPRALSLQAAVVLHLFQVIFYTLWGALGWTCLKQGPPLNVRVDGEGPPRL